MTEPSLRPMHRALLSVSDKTGLREFAAALHEGGVGILATGGTAALLREAKIPVTLVEDMTKFPECFSGRMKTLHPLLLGGILFRRGDREHEEEAKRLGIQPIDLVVVNLYPFETDRQVEQMDIGGPTLLRSAAKNHDAVTVVCDPGDYDRVLAEIEGHGNTTPKLRKELAAKAFLRTAAYDSAITEWLSGGAHAGAMLTRRRELRYGENPHQRGAYYAFFGEDPGWSVLQEEKQMSYLNILDADAAWNLVREFSDPTAACVKHANPSGVASHRDIAEAFQRSYDADRLSAFGVIIALNRPCTGDLVRKILDQKIFAEILIAPGYAKEALDLLRQRPKLRVLDASNLHPCDHTYRTALGGVLMQEEDMRTVTEKDVTAVTSRKPTKDQMRDLLFAWNVVKHAKSNAIVFAKGAVTVGIGCGQTSRVDATWIAARRSGDRAQGAVMASDAFFPFPDSVEEAAKHGIAAIIQPGGSLRDREVFTRAEELGIAMVVTGVRAFRH